MNTNYLHKATNLPIAYTMPVTRNYFGTFNFDITPCRLPGFTYLISFYTHYLLIAPSPVSKIRCHCVIRFT